MESIIHLLGEPSWWFSSVFVGLLVSVTANIFTGFLKSVRPGFQGGMDVFGRAFYVFAVSTHIVLYWGGAWKDFIGIDSFGVRLVMGFIHLAASILGSAIVALFETSLVVSVVYVFLWVILRPGPFVR